MVSIVLVKVVPVVDRCDKCAMVAAISDSGSLWGTIDVSSVVSLAFVSATVVGVFLCESFVESELVNSVSCSFVVLSCHAETSDVSYPIPPLARKLGV